uniref:4Fe-4S dicluster domain-containing protein n=1 Tax=Geoglobus ahangari TaxID=113653 RepID=A0A7C4W3Q2_9EURY
MIKKDKLIVVDFWAEWCSQVCPTDALIRLGGKVVDVDPSKCKECYECVKICPYDTLIQMD